MINDFELIYIGESLEAYLDIAQTNSWESSAIASESSDRKNSDLIIISSEDKARFQKLSLDKNLSSYAKGFEIFEPFPFVLNFCEEKIFLGRESEKNRQELERRNFLKNLSCPKNKKILNNAFNHIFWNKVTKNELFLEQEYFYCKKQSLLGNYKDTYCQNNGTYIIGEVNEICPGKPRTISFDSLWGKCLVNKLKIDQYSRLEGKYEFNSNILTTCYEKITLKMELAETLSFLPQVFVDQVLKDQWVPFAFLNFQGSSLILDVYIKSDQTLKGDYLEKIAKAFLAKINRIFQIPIQGHTGVLLTHTSVFDFDVEEKLDRKGHFQRININ